MAVVKVKEVLNEIKEKSALILESKVNANLLVDLLEFSDYDKQKVVVAFIKAIYKIFGTFANRGELFVKISAKKIEDANLDQEEEETQNNISSDPQDVFSQWLFEKYLLCVQKLLDLMHHEGNDVREFAVCTLMKFVVMEGTQKQATVSFPNMLFKKIIKALLDSKHDMKDLIGRFAEYIEYDDVKFYSLKNVSSFIEFEKRNFEGKFGPYFVRNIFALLSKVKVANSEDELDTFLVMQGKPVSDKKKPQVFSLNGHRKVFSTCWLEFLRCELPSDVHKKILLNLHSEVIPSLTDPKLLIDFLSDSYNAGGVTSLLALNGLFILIQKHNLDYPDFYKKLYALFEPGIFHVKYKERFFYLADLFLMSTHLPAYLVAAFAKRLARMALSAPPSGVMIAVAFVCNLLRRHPSCQVLIHRKQAVKLFLENEEEHENDIHSIAGDPYKVEETDPADSNALNSCLWELQTLQEHYYHSISSLIEMFKKPLDKDKESDISEYFDVSYESLFEKECCKVTSQNTFLEFKPPTGFLGKDFLDYWTL